MVALVIVAHSQAVATGVCQMAAQMAQGRVRMIAAGGAGDADTLGTDATQIAGAIRTLASEPECDGILILVDLGSATLSAETALDLLAGEAHPPILISGAPLVEGAVAAAVSAAAGNGLADVEAEACAVVAAKLQEPAQPAERTSRQAPSADEIHMDVPLALPHGLHARPAAALVGCAAAHAVRLRLRDVTTGSGWVEGGSLTRLMTLGARQGDQLELAVRGERAAQAAREMRVILTRESVESIRAEPQPRPGHQAPEGALTGIPASPGRAAGPVLQLSAQTPVVLRLTAKDARAEVTRLRQARQTAQTTLEGDIQRARRNGQLAQAELLLAYSLLLEDPALVSPAEAEIVEQGRSAEAAWEGAVAAATRSLEAHTDEYQRARAIDVRQVGNRVLRLLLGGSDTNLEIRTPGILVAEDLSPTQLVGLDPLYVLGLCTAAGNSTSHASILARALGIPAVVGCGEGVLRLAEGAWVVLDGDRGYLAPDLGGQPAAPAAAGGEAAVRAHAKEVEEARLPAITRDGRRIEVAANIGSLAEAQILDRFGAEGVGVLRTEFLYLGRQQAPDEEEQVQVYQQILRACAGSPVIVRTLDIGGDKRLPYVDSYEEANPFLGMRGLRLSLAMPDLLRRQLRALLRAGVEPGLRVMFPMVTTLEELRQARQLVEQAREDLRRAGIPQAADVPLGMMVEVPAAALMAEAFAGETSFMSVGTNDLVQYVQAADRTSPHMAKLGDAASPAVLRLVSQVVQAAHAAGIWAGVCGEVATDPAVLPILVGLEVDELSMTLAAIPRVKAQIRRLDSKAARQLARQALAASSAAEVRALTEQSP